MACRFRLSRGPLKQTHATLQQIQLVAVCSLKSRFPRMHRNQARRSGSVLMMTSTERQHFQVRARLGAPVNVVDADNWLVDAIHAAGYAAKSGKLIVQALFCC